MPRLRSEVYNQTSRFYTLENLTPNDFRHFIVDEKSKLIYCALSKERFYTNSLFKNYFFSSIIYPVCFNFYGLLTFNYQIRPHEILKRPGTQTGRKFLQF